MTTATDHSVDMNHPTYYHPYPTYKASGVEWLGEVPEGWELRPIFAMYQRRIERDHPDEQLLSVYREYGVVPREGREDNYNRPSEDLSSYQLVKPRDLAINKMKTWQGSVAISEYQGIVSPAYIICRPTHTEHDRFLHYLLRSPRYIVRYGQLSYGVRVGQWDMRFEDFRRIEALIPPLPEQRAIAAFLDHKTAEIDALIAAKERLIALLREKRAALITSAVTKGLDPDVPMKDSGIEWLGEVPEGWEVKPLGRLGALSKGNGSSKQDEADAGVPCVRYGDLYTTHNYFIGSTRAYIDPERAIDYTPIRFGDVLFAASGETVEEIGKSAVNLMTSRAYCGGDIILFRPKQEMDARYLGYASDSRPSVAQKASMGRGYTVIHIYGSQLKNLILPLPPLPEQHAIAGFLDRRTAGIDALVGKVEEAIDRLKEYRTALISAAVTGKIDVREEAAKK